MKKPFVIFVALIAIAIVQTIYYFPRVPEVMASHFNGVGDTNEWSSKLVFFGIYVGVLALTVFIFTVIPNKFIHRSRTWLNLPNKEYWLAPERKDQTINFMRNHMMNFGIANVLLAIIVVQLVILANFDSQPKLEQGIMWALAIYFVYLAYWLIRYFMIFKRASA